MGFDWDITKKDNINGTFGYDYFGNSNAGSLNRESILSDSNGNTLSDLNDVINTSNKSHEYAYDFDLGYTKKFKKEDQELEILFNSSNGYLNDYYEQAQKHLPSDTIFDSSHGNNPGIENETNFEVNYTQPLGEDAVFETGAKMVLDHINSISDVYQLNTESDNFIYDTSKSSSMDGRRTVSGAYLSFTFKLFDWLGIKAGLRDEYTDENVVFSNSGHVSLTPYNIIVPSVVLSHKFKNKQLLKISYTHRVERPEYDDMNPFLNAADPKNITTGNPHLRPEIGDKIELGYNQTFKNGLTITPTLFYRGNKDDIQWYVNYYPTYTIGDSTYTNVAISTRENIGREDNYGLSLFASIPATKKISLRANINCFQRYIYTGMASGGDIHGFAYRTNMNVAYQLNNSLIIEMTGNFNSRKINAQGTMPATTTYSFAFRKQLFHKKGSIAITATNFFDKYINQKTKLTGENFTISNTRQLPYRSFGINFTYKFGKMEFKEVEDINLTCPPGN